MPQDPSAALSSLLRGASIDDHEEVLNAAEVAIKANSNNQVACHTKAVALLKLDRFEDAAKFIGETGLDSKCPHELAYALYKTGRLQDATDVIKKTDTKDRGLDHIAAQVAYRAERFQDAENIYEKLLAEGDDDEESDLKINLEAVHAQCEWAGLPSSTQSPNAIPDSFELCYNIACFRIARGHYDSATKLLQRAAMLCKASDDLHDDDKEVELRPIWVQQAYVYAKQGKTKEALDLYNSLGSTDDPDADFTVVAKSNLNTLDTKTTNPYLAQRIDQSIVDAGVKAKLFGYQANCVKHNTYVSSLAASKAEGVERSTHNMLVKSKLQPSTEAAINSISAMNAAAVTYMADNQAAAIKKLRALMVKRPLDVGLALSVVQLLIQQKRSGAALSVLEAFLERLEKAEGDNAKDVRFSPGLIALSVSLMKSQGRHNAAKSQFVQAANHWTSHSASAASHSILRESGIALMRSSNPEDLKLAGSAFEKLNSEQKSGSHIASAGLVAALAAVEDTSKSDKHAKDLPAVDTLIQGIDSSALLKAGVAVIPGLASTSTKRPAATQESSEATTKKRRTRKLPKNYAEGKTPDPERWLPLRDRSTYRPKNKKGKKKVADSTQGGVVKEETLELVGGGGVKVEKSGGGSNNKKKKKGKK